jgi:hypothetical protein
MSFTIIVRADQDGWRLEGDTVENGMMFLRGADAEAVALSLAERYADAGEPTEIEVFLRDGSLAGHYVTVPNGAPMCE